VSAEKQNEYPFTYPAVPSLGCWQVHMSSNVHVPLQYDTTRKPISVVNLHQWCQEVNSQMAWMSGYDDGVETRWQRRQAAAPAVVFSLNKKEVKTHHQSIAKEIAKALLDGEV